jgi:glutamyl-tRNA synthetase
MHLLPQDVTPPPQHINEQIPPSMQGYLNEAMMNYLSLLGWNDGSEKEIYTVEELQKAFSLERITKSPAVFDKVKLSWMNGQHLRSLPAEEARSFLKT